MTSAFDNRIVQVGIEIDGELMLYEGLDIRASGTKFYATTNNQCSIRISNLTKDHQNYILTKATPLAPQGQSPTPINITLDVGRESYGTFRLFEGQAWAMGATQPPDIGIILESLTNNIDFGFIQATSFSTQVSLKTIAQKIADLNGLTLDFKVTNDKMIENYSYTGAVAKQLKKFSEMGGIAVTLQNKTLIVRDANTPINDATILIDAIGGMVGIPLVNMGGVTVRTLINSSINIGSKIRIKSEINPAADGDYFVYAMTFEVANRDVPFWYVLDCKPLWSFGGTQ
jgi:hypothetical protein